MDGQLLRDEVLLVDGQVNMRLTSLNDLGTFTK